MWACASLNVWIQCSVVSGNTLGRKGWHSNPSLVKRVTRCRVLATGCKPIRFWCWMTVCGGKLGEGVESNSSWLKCDDPIRILIYIVLYMWCWMTVWWQVGRRAGWQIGAVYWGEVALLMGSHSAPVYNIHYISTLLFRSLYLTIFVKRKRKGRVP